MRIFFYIFLFTVSHLLAEDWQRVYLASYPRSGNHWMRYLIEETTHIATSSVYCDSDFPHIKEPFPWGGYSLLKGYEGKSRLPTIKDIIVIKTHYPVYYTHFDLQPHKLIIRIVRHPIDTFCSWYYYNKNYSYKKDDYKKFLLEEIKTWRDFQNFWNHQDNVYTIRYEDLLDNPKEVFKNVMIKIGYRVTDAAIERAVKKHIPRGRPLKHLDFFSNSELKLIANELKDLLNFFNYEIPLNVFEKS